VFGSVYLESVRGEEPVPLCVVVPLLLVAQTQLLHEVPVLFFEVGLIDQSVCVLSTPQTVHYLLQLFLRHMGPPEEVLAGGVHLRDFEVAQSPLEEVVYSEDFGHFLHVDLDLHNVLDLDCLHCAVGAKFSQEMFKLVEDLVVVQDLEFSKSGSYFE